MSDDRKNDKQLGEIEEEELDKVSGGVNSDSARAGGGGGGRNADTLTTKKGPIT